MDFEFENKLKGRVVLVAGGFGGLGTATVALLARDGAKVVSGYRSDSVKAEGLRTEIEQEYGGRIELVAGDIRDPLVRKQYVETARSIGGLYGFVGFTGDPARVKFDEAGAEDLVSSYDGNFVAPALLAREAAAAMRRDGIEGAVVLVSSMQAIAPFDSSINYAAPKAALIHASRVMAKQWGGPAGIRVNIVAPGVNRAGMALKSIESGKYDRYIERGIISRFGRPEDVARVVRLLLEPDNYITGQVIAVDGGLTIRRDQG